MLTWGPLKGRIHPAGWPFIIGAAVGGLLFLFFVPTLFWLFLFLTLCVAAFFREPVRVSPKQDNVLVAPADGMLVAIEKAAPPLEVGIYREGEWRRLSIFLSLFDVHVNRIPDVGRVLGTFYHKGKFLNASLDKASDVNERNSVVMETSSGVIIVTQIAGLLARRIQCDVSIGDMVTRGQTFGMIRFGSRVDLYIPASAKVKVLKGQRMVGGETVMAQFS